MSNKEVVKRQLAIFREKINNSEFVKRHKTKKEAFTRARKLGFVKTMLIKLNFAKRSGAVEVYKFFREIVMEEPVSRQAYEKSRNQISYTAFEELFEDSAGLAISTEDSTLYKGYRVMPIDGTTVQLDKNEETKEIFGKSTPQEGKVFARISMCADILNDTVLDGRIAGYDVGERKLAMMHIEKDICENALYLLDRGYWSFELAESIIKRGRKFLIRLASNSLKAVTNNNQNSGYVEVRRKTKTYRLRFYSLQLESGEMEYLITNLNEAEVIDEELKELYGLRWGIETKYNEMKNRLLFEDFTGKSELIIKQDFYATLLIMNMIAFAVMAAEGNIPAKERKYEYKINKNTAIGMLRNNLIRAVLEDNPKRNSMMLDKLMKDISRCIVPIRKGRHNKRNKFDLKNKKKTGIKSAI